MHETNREKLRKTLCRMLPPLVLCAACGSTGPKSFSDLERPAYGVESRGVDTSSTVALDGRGGVWKGGFFLVGGSGFSYVRDATAAERARVVSAFAALPADAGCFSHLDLLENDQSWPACTDDAGTPVPPWAQAADSVQALAR